MRWIKLRRKPMRKCILKEMQKGKTKKDAKEICKRKIQNEN